MLAEIAEDAAYRNDVRKFENKMLRNTMIGYILGALLLGGLLLAGLVVEHFQK